MPGDAPRSPHGFPQPSTPDGWTPPPGPTPTPPPGSDTATPRPTTVPGVGGHPAHSANTSQHTSARRLDPGTEHTPTRVPVPPPVSGRPDPAPDPFGAPAPGESGPVRVVVTDDNPVVRAGLTALLSGRGEVRVVAEAADGRQAYEAAWHHRPDVVLLDVRMPGVDGLAALPHLTQVAPVLMLTYSDADETVREALRLGARGYLVHGEFQADELIAAVHHVRRGQPYLSPTAAGVLLTQLRDSAGGPPGHAHHPGAPPVSPGPETGDPPPAATEAPEPPPHRPDHVPATRSAGRFGLSAREAEVMELIASGMVNSQIADACFISEKTVKNHVNRIFAKLHAESRSEAIARWLGTAPRERAP
ncbi:response regulator [Streptomyces sp. AJS327]|uniref:response regulator n=1 Tax=Streptomyces sp. AJS327 TaxID=2545265 RepID=UPI0015DF4F9E|nr:response regulator transcription factor [Streptomyces sp. AJS327]MBA0051317.1 response regulator [Streptomyces sp. AJS327]